MDRVIISAHGSAASSLKGSVEMILGTLDDAVYGIDFSANESLSSLSKRMEERLDTTRMTYIFVDIKGGTPFNAAYLLSKKYPIRLVCGVNLGMLLECLIKRAQEEEFSMLEIAEEAGKSAIETFDFMKKEELV